MSYSERAAIYEEIENLRTRPLITYVTSIRPNVDAIIAPDVIPELIKQIKSIPVEKKEVDFLVVSNGGDAIAAARIISLLRERFDKVAVVLPYVAYSAATLLAMGADEIIMHPFSNLGPVDPQLTYKKSDGNEVHYGTEDLRNYLSFVRDDVKINDQSEMLRAFELLCNEAGAIPIGIAKRGSHLSAALGEQLLSLHMQDKSKAKAITETLSRSYHHHGYPVGRKDALQVGLPIHNAETKIEDLIWRVWENIENEMQCNKVFNPLEIVINSSSGQKLLAPPVIATFPSNFPQNLTQDVFIQLVQQHGKIVEIPPVDYELFLATMESVRCYSQNRTKGKLFAIRTPDTNINLNGIQTSSGWTFSTK